METFTIAIIGGGSVGLKLAKKLEELKINVKIIERSEERCELLAEELNHSLVIKGDGTDLELLNEVFQYVPKALEKISVFNDYTTAINIDYALRNDISMKSGKGFMLVNINGNIDAVTK